MKTDDEIRLRHMLDASHEAMAFSRNRTRADLNTDRMLVLALTKAVEVIGEAASHITEPTKNELSSIPWADIVGMRNRLVHAYFDINLDILWETVHDDLPILNAQLELLITEADDNLDDTHN